MTTHPPGEAGYTGPLSSHRRAYMPARLGAFRLGATRLGFAPKDIAGGTAAPNKFYSVFRDDAEPGTYAPPRPVTTFTPVIR